MQQRRIALADAFKRNEPTDRGVARPFASTHALVGERGRGATANPSGRFEAEERVVRDRNWDFADTGWPGDSEGLPPFRTTVTPERTRSVLTRNASPDIPFDRSLNPYRGCEHGCIYCYARPTHEYLGLSAGIDFETRLFAKPEAAALLKQELARPGYRCQVVAMGTNTDPYQPIERRLEITRRILEVMSDCDHPVGMVTKSHGIVRDLDIWSALAARRLAQVHISVTTLDTDLARAMEPRAATPRRRLEAVRRLAAAGVPTGIMVAPVIPGLNDTEMEAILEEAAEAGATTAGKTLLHLPRGVMALFRAWLYKHCPQRAHHVLALVRDTRGGRLNDSRFHYRMSGSGAYAAMLDRRFRIACRRFGLNQNRVSLDTTRFRPPRANGQLVMF